MTPAEFVEAVRTLHAPYLPEVVSVLCTDPCDPDYNQGEWHDPSVAERAASLELWCDGCRLPASRCQVAHLLALVDVS
jgi:hypothetical protein